MNDKPMKVLLVEDNAGDVRLIREALTEANAKQFKLVHVERLADALKRLAKEKWDVVLLDLSLPDAHGLETVMRVHVQAPDAPIVVLTSLDDETVAVKALREGAQDYLVKGQVDGNLLVRAMRYAIERKRTEREKQQLHEQLTHAQKMEALGTLAGGVAHEFNNVNAIIIGYIDLTLRSGELSSATRKNLETARTAASRAGALTRSLLTLSRKNISQRKRVNLRDIVDEVLRTTGKEFTTEGIEVVIGHSSRVPRVMGDPDLLTHVVINLAINARHALLESPVKKLTIETGVDKGRPFIRVTDTGCGIPKEAIPGVFEPFFTTKRQSGNGKVRDEKAGGTGLGLSVCNSIVEAHGGKIKVSSHVGKGTTFTVYLPSASDTERLQREIPQEQNEGAPRIMVIDDEECITELIVQILVHAGYAADGFTNPMEGLEFLREKQYALAFIDLQMPEMNGRDFMGNINRLPAKKRPLKVILTGRPERLRKDYSHLDVFTILRKPFSNRQVLEIVEEGIAAKQKPDSEKGARTRVTAETA